MSFSKWYSIALRRFFIYAETWGYAFTSAYKTGDCLVATLMEGSVYFCYCDMWKIMLFYIIKLISRLKDESEIRESH